MRELTVAASTGLLFAYAGIRDARQDPGQWAKQLSILSEQGFAAIDLSELWLPMADLTTGQVDQLAQAAAGAGLDIAGVSIIDVDLASEAKVAEGRAKIARAIGVTKALGAPFLSIGLHALPTGGQLPPQWTARDPDELQRIGRELHPLAQDAALQGIELSLEMFERGVLDRSANVLAIIKAARGAVGANPDLANLLRAPWPLVEQWDETFDSLAPHVNYWHVKNGVRTTLPDGTAIYHPTDMQHGGIDYRSAIQTAVRHGFRGPLLIEHYGGDAIAHAAAGRAYLTRTIDDVCAYEGIEIKELQH